MVSNTRKSSHSPFQQEAQWPPSCVQDDLWQQTSVRRPYVCCLVTPTISVFTLQSLFTSHIRCHQQQLSSCYVLQFVANSSEEINQNYLMKVSNSCLLPRPARCNVHFAYIYNITQCILCNDMQQSQQRFKCFYVCILRIYKSTHCRPSKFKNIMTNLAKKIELFWP